jgi:hypothetical protein
MADLADPGKEIDLVRSAVVQIGQLVQRSPKMNGNRAMWKELAYRVETERNALCKHAGGQALFADLLHPCAAVYTEMWDSLQSSITDSGQEDPSQPEQTKRRKRDKFQS